MSGKKKIDYRKVLRKLKAILPVPAVRYVMVDFEKALWAALREVLPNVTIRGCVFHWTQALWRKVSTQNQKLALYQ